MYIRYPLLTLVLGFGAFFCQTQTQTLFDNEALIKFRTRNKNKKTDFSSVLFVCIVIVIVTVIIYLHLTQ